MPYYSDDNYEEFANYLTIIDNIIDSSDTRYVYVVGDMNTNIL